MKFSYICLLAALASPVFGAPRGPSMLDRLHMLFNPMKIVGGQPAAEGQFPHQISLQWEQFPGSWMHYCGGSIITDTLIFTAAHCLEGISPSSFRVLAGALDVNDLEGGQLRRVSRAVQHPDFDMWFDIVNDMAFIIVDQPFDFSDPNVSPIKVAPRGSNPSTGSRDCTASGWGNSFFGGPTSQKLNFVHIDHISDNTCESNWNFVANVYPDQNICAGTSAGGESVCQGDSGGPLTCELQGGDGTHYLFGATSWGSSNCGEAGRPAVWAEINYFRDWLEQTSGITIPV